MECEFYMITEKEIKLIKRLYPTGTRVVLDYMDDVQAPPSGTKGTVTSVDDIGQVHVDWENGSSLALNTNLDTFHVLID